MRGFLDDRVLFIDEDGVVSGLDTFRAGSPAVPPGCVSSKVTLKDWVLHHTGDVAVSSFIDDQVADFGGQSVNYQFLSAETWVRHGASWKLLGSQTIPLHKNPPAASLSAKELDEYVGDYSDGAGLTVAVSRDGDALASSVNGEKATPLVPEDRDLFFRPDTQPGYARRRIVFRRDAGGRVTEYVSRTLVLHKKDSAAASKPADAPLPDVSPKLTLRDFVVHRSGNVALATFFHDRVSNFHGHAILSTYRSMETWVKRDQVWKMMASQGRELQPDPPAANPAPHPLTDYVGTYAASPALKVGISKAGETLLFSANGAKPIVLTPEAGDVFFSAGAPRTSVVFRRNRTGCVLDFLSRREERDVTFTREWSNGDSLLNADRVLAARSHAIGFVAAYSEAMAPDARKLDAGVPTAKGRDSILSLMAKYPAGLQVDWNPEEAVVSSGGDFGYTWGRFIATSHDDKGKLVSEYGRYLDVWRRQSDGRWLWIADIGTLDPPPA
jgi:ketosteroid isomerase-like protein